MYIPLAVADPANCIRRELILRFFLYVGGSVPRFATSFNFPLFSAFKIWKLLFNKGGACRVRPFIDPPLPLVNMASVTYKTPRK